MELSVRATIVAMNFKHGWYETELPKEELGDEIAHPSQHNFQTQPFLTVIKRQSGCLNFYHLSLVCTKASQRHDTGGP